MLPQVLVEQHTYSQTSAEGVRCILLRVKHWLAGFNRGDYSPTLSTKYTRLHFIANRLIHNQAIRYGTLRSDGLLHGYTVARMHGCPDPQEVITVPTNTPVKATQGDAAAIF